MKVREALAADIPALTTLRMALFCEVGELARPDEDPVLREATQAYFMQAQEEGSARSWVVEEEGEVVACATLALFVRPPYPGNLAGRVPAQHLHPAGLAQTGNGECPAGGHGGVCPRAATGQAVAPCQQ